MIRAEPRVVRRGPLRRLPVRKIRGWQRKNRRYNDRSPVLDWRTSFVALRPASFRTSPLLSRQPSPIGKGTVALRFVREPQTVSPAGGWKSISASSIPTGWDCGVKAGHPPRRSLCSQIGAAKQRNRLLSAPGYGIAWESFMERPRARKAESLIKSA